MQLKINFRTHSTNNAVQINNLFPTVVTESQQKKKKFIRVDSELGHRRTMRSEPKEVPPPEGNY